MNESLALMILGMHRSGTSALAGVIARLGFVVPGTPLAADAFNEKGFYESREIVAFNERVLRRLGSSWDDPVPMDITGASVKLVENLASLLRRLDPAPHLLVKDPRLCLTAPLWTEALTSLGRRIAIVLIVRNPVEVAQSLARREGMARSQALLLWLKYTLQAETSTRASARVVTTYDNLMQDWRSVMARISARVSLPWPNASRSVEDDIDGFLAKDLRHFGQGGDFADHAVERLCAQAWRACQRLAEEPSDGEAMRSLDTVGDAIDVATEILGPFVHRPAIPGRRAPHLNGLRLVESGRPEVWLVFHGRRHHVASPAVYDALFDTVEDLHALPSLKMIETGPDLTDGTCLVRDEQTGIIYLICKSDDGLVRRYKIPSYVCFRGFRFDTAKVQTVNALVLSALPEGPEVDVASDPSGEAEVW